MIKQFLICALLLSGSFSQAVEIQSWEHYDSEYEVPTPESLKQFATFPMSGVRVRQEAGHTELRYRLPRELTGREVHVQLIGALDEVGNGKLEGPIAKAVCANDDCALNYPGLNVDPNEVRAFLMQQGFKGAELDQRLEVAHFFRSGDPAGIIHIKRNR